jgi:hypothetical protein
MNTARKAALVLAVTGASIGATAGSALADANAGATAVGSPGVLSGNIVQIPVSVPIQIVGNSLNLVGVLNPTFGNAAVSD